MYVRREKIHIVRRLKGVDRQMTEDERKTYYVAVGAGQVLADPHAAAFEFEIRANREELNKLQEMFEETADEDESAMIRFGPENVTVSEVERSAVYDSQIHDIYKLLHQLGTEDTKRHIESIDILKKSDERECVQDPC
jgi:transcriptional/translational regulatory protein YebC/TACO1